MFTLNTHLETIAGGAYSQACYDAYVNMIENKSLTNGLLTLLFFPLGIAAIYGDIKEVEGVCGGGKLGRAAYNEAKEAYCLTHPSICKDD